MSVVAAFRVHTWDVCVAELARRFFAACSGTRQVVLADETRGRLPIQGYEVVWTTDDSSALGLPNHPPGRSLWYNNDYGIYVLRAAFPGYDHYMMAEYDIAVNLDLTPMLEAVATRRIDLVAHQIQRPPADWGWLPTTVGVFDDVWQAMVFFMVVSDRAAELLLRERRNGVAAFAAGGQWPFAEAFVPSVLQREGMLCAEVGEFAGTANLHYRPHIALDDPRANAPGTLVHSVIARERYVETIITDYDPAEWLNPASEMREALLEVPFAQVWPLLLERFKNAGDHTGYQEFRRQVAARGIALEVPRDLAYCKPAIVSSVSEWSRSASPQMEAAGANGAVLHEDYGFHTRAELNPWWAIDLLENFVVFEIEIVNRREAAERFRNFVVQTSLDGSLWVTRFLKLDASEVSADAERPHRILMSDPFLARHVRIMLLGAGILHLRRVRIFGRALAPI